MADTKSIICHHSFHIPQAGLVRCFYLAICLPAAEHSPICEGPPKAVEAASIFLYIPVVATQKSEHVRWSGQEKGVGFWQTELRQTPERLSLQ